MDLISSMVMTNIFPQIIILLVCLMSVELQNCPQKGISSHKINTKNGLRLTTLRRGNFTIQGLMTFTEKDCKTVDASGLLRVYALKYAIETANKDTNRTRWGEIGYQLDNLCFDMTNTMSRGIEVVSLHRPNSVCRADFLQCDPRQNISSEIKPALAVVGTLRSVTSIPLASLLALYHIPQVSFGASSRILSKRSIYKSFFRTIPSDTNQIKVMLDIMVRFNWNYVFAIGSADDYGKLGISELKQKANARDICVTDDEYVDYESDDVDKKVDEITDKMKNSENKKAKVVVLFCYAKTIGAKILKSAQEKGIQRVWLTSESWNPHGLSLGPTVGDQLVGVLTVSIMASNVAYLDDYIEQEIKENFKCDMWLQNYMHSKFQCHPKSLSADGLLLDGTGSGCPCRIRDVMDKLRTVSGFTQKLVDAVTALTHSILKSLQKKCGSNNKTCTTDISPKDVTNELYNITFTNEQDDSVSFDSNGDPANAFYTIENIMKVNNTFIYVPVGNWSSARKGSGRLVLDVDLIKWPLWFTPTPSNRTPFSRCKANCQPGWYMVGKHACCWDCEACCGNTYSNATNSVKCTECPSGHHAVNHSLCNVTPYNWLRISDPNGVYNPMGLSIASILGIGLLLTFIAACVLLKYRNVEENRDSSHLLWLCVLLPFVMFGYGTLHLMKPSDMVCQAVNSIFFLLLMLNGAIVMVKTTYFTNSIMKHMGTVLCNNIGVAKLLCILALFSLEGAAVFSWIHIENIQMYTQYPTHTESKVKPEILLLCDVDTKPGWFVSLFIPFSIIFVTAIFAFQERNGEHTFHEPKFLSFACIAQCIILLAYIPTYRYAGSYKAIVIAITIDLFALIFLVCFVLPRLYVAVMVGVFGAEKFTVKPAFLPPKINERRVTKECAASMPVTNDITPVAHLSPINETSSPVAAPSVTIAPGKDPNGVAAGVDADVDAGVDVDADVDKKSYGTPIEEMKCLDNADELMNHITGNLQNGILNPNIEYKGLDDVE